MTKATSHLSSTLGPLFTIVIGAVLILVAVHYLGKLLKLLTVGNACSGEGDQHRLVTVEDWLRKVTPMPEAMAR